jgi:proteasome lid subunit RPN8/RPN11
VRPEESASEYRWWKTPGDSLAIGYTPRVMDDMCGAAKEGFQAIPHGGIEVGGLLFGKRNGDGLLILDWRPIECAHAKGPGFELSEKDEEALRQTLLEAAAEPGLLDLEPVGWFHSHTRSGIFLSPADLQLHDRYFPRVWQVALVLRPAKEGPVKGAFFFREPDGSIRAEAAYEEFEVDVAARRRLTMPAPQVQTAGKRAPRQEAVPVAQPTPAKQPIPAPRQPRPAAAVAPPLAGSARPKATLRWVPLLALMVCLVAVIGVVVAEPQWFWTEADSLSLHVAETKGQLLITWDRTAAAIQEWVTRNRGRQLAALHRTQRN